MVAHDLPDDGQAQPAAAGVAAAGRVGAPQPVEDQRQVLGGDAGAGVDHLEHGPVAAGVRAQRDRPAGRGGPHRVGDQVAHGLPDPVGVDVGDQRARGPDGQLDAGGVGVRPVRGADRLDQFGEVGRRPVVDQRAGLGERQLLQVVDDALVVDDLVVQ